MMTEIWVRVILSGFVAAVVLKLVGLETPFPVIMLTVSLLVLVAHVAVGVGANTREARRRRGQTDEPEG